MDPSNAVTDATITTKNIRHGNKKKRPVRTNFTSPPAKKVKKVAGKALEAEKRKSSASEEEDIEERNEETGNKFKKTPLEENKTKGTKEKKTRRVLFSSGREQKRQTSGVGKKFSAVRNLLAAAPAQAVRLLGCLGDRLWSDVTGTIPAPLNGELRVLTFNIWFARTNRRARFDGLMDLLFGEWKVPDVVTLQEVCEEVATWILQEPRVQKAYIITDVRELFYENWFANSNPPALTPLSPPYIIHITSSPTSCATFPDGHPRVYARMISAGTVCSRSSRSPHFQRLCARGLLL